MRLLSRQSKSFAQVCNLKNNAYAFSLQISHNRKQHPIVVPKKAYQKLFSGDDISQLPKLPSVKMLDSMRSKQISKIMLFNYELNHDQIFQSQIQCFYSMVSRFQPSIQSMSLLLDQIYKNLVGLHSEFPQVKFQAQKRALIPIMKPSLLGKLVYIGQIIEPYYNEYLKIMLATFVARAIYFSGSSQKQREQQQIKLNRLREDVFKNGKQLFVQGAKVAAQKYEEYFQIQEKELRNIYPSLQLQDFLQGSYYVLSNQYYTEEMLQLIVKKLEKYGFQDENNLALTIWKIKLLGVLHKFQHFRAVHSKKNQLFQTLYNQNVNRYFKLLGDSKRLFQLTNSKNQILQQHLVISQFLTNQHFNQAKELYLKIFNQIFDTINNGCLLCDIKKLRGAFEILIVMYNYRDTKKIHQLLKKIEKTIVSYPFVRMQKFQTYVYVCEKFGYKSDIVAEKYFNILTQIKQRLTSLKGLLPHLHLYTRQLSLARKFLTYLQIVQKGSKEQIQLAHKYISQLFDPNIWYCFSQNQQNSYGYFTTPSFNSFLFFVKINVTNLTSGFEQKKKIDQMAQKINLFNMNKKSSLILNQLYDMMKLTPLKLTHASFWRHNHHSRMLSTLRLAVHHYQYLKRRNNNEALSFMEQFLEKTINNRKFYNAFKSSMAYPGMFDMMLQIMQCADPKQFPIQNRDMQVLKTLFNKNLQKLKKMQERQLSKETDKIKYQSFLDFVEINTIYLPYQKDFYGFGGIILNLQNSSTYDSMIRYKNYKQYIRMQIQTFCKFRRQNDIQVIVNYHQYPHIADVLIKNKERAIVIMIKITNDPQQAILNHKQLEMQKMTEQFWKKKGYFVIYLKSKKQIEEFIDSKIKDAISRLQQQKI